MTDPLEDMFKEDERKKDTVKLYPAQCPGYIWQGKVNPVIVVFPHMYNTPVKPEEQVKTHVCEDCAEHYARDDKLRGRIR